MADEANGIDMGVTPDTGSIPDALIMRASALSTTLPLAGGLLPEGVVPLAGGLLPEGVVPLAGGLPPEGVVPLAGGLLPEGELPLVEVLLLVEEEPPEEELLPFVCPLLWLACGA